MKQGKKHLTVEFHRDQRFQKKHNNRYHRTSLKIPVQNYFCHRLEMKPYRRTYLISVGSVWSKWVHPIVKKGHQYLDSFGALNYSLHMQELAPYEAKFYKQNKIHMTKCRHLCVS